MANNTCMQNASCRMVFLLSSIYNSLLPDELARLHRLPTYHLKHLTWVQSQGLPAGSGRVVGTRECWWPTAPTNREVGDKRGN
ncbi:unnamed protein product [Protopolystoma xenopodis]|uniref:Uncharacterized protein n=1 Tax=Protopolystoma xenopodis TaxID=117903 RepID=A0A448WDG5_9PLAT|nr:unnamed protein product [Protopolystoma xenopodis]